MGVGAALMPLMRSTPPSGIRRLTRDEETATALVTAAIDGEYVAAEAARVAAARPSPPIETSAPEQAFLFDATGEPGKSIAHVGRVTWRLDRAKPDLPGLMPVTLKADVEIPDMGLTALLTMTRAADAHTPPIMTLAFAPAPDASIRAIERIGLPRPRSLGPQGAVALSGTVRTTGPNTFQIRLTGDEVTRSSGEEAIEARPWLEIPLMFAGGTSGRLELEHAESGTPVIEQAAAAWRAMPGDKGRPAGATSTR